MHFCSSGNCGFKNIGEMQMEEVCSNSNNFFSRIRGKANRNKHVLKCKETKCHSILRKHFKASDKDFDSMDVASPYKGRS